MTNQTKLSQFGQQLTLDSGIFDLMADLGQALNVNPDLLFLGGGNPAKIEAFEQLIADYLHQIADDPKALNQLVGIYQSPQGSEILLDLLVEYFNQNYDWPISRKNIAITNGSQSAFFILINMLAGHHPDAHKHFLFPVVPEYLGYSDQALGEGYFKGCKPQIELIGEREFKYKIDFEKLNITAQTAAMCVSRPTNPTGNMISDQELAQLSELARNHRIPLIIDCAYGAPFPDICYQPLMHPWDENHINVFSLSKLGLPAVRTGIVIANEDIINSLVKVNTIMSLANGNLGPALLTKLLQNNQLDLLCEQHIKPFYQQKRDHLISQIQAKFSGIQYRIHQPQGAFFVWLWFENLNISSTELYQILKQKGVLVMDGYPFFFALPDDWSHKHQCLRLSYCQSDEILTQAVEIMAEVLHGLAKH
ncbi:valine--pyruvate transaminase [Catenovulum sp. 2E275]|uniref:valine--pyruvate transaminase n=1 Tax=Catenovulum sp. 2E275 TaxID=2980497 RepID=UPI0021CFD8BF|nr:valine--pyruvate transaminase [Catenovulum sp. 2E275]MCU4674591.1 valine--pyruvate transaminase [Catenovulum sp. 2E275]